MTIIILLIIGFVIYSICKKDEKNSPKLDEAREMQFFYYSLIGSNGPKPFVQGYFTITRSVAKITIRGLNKVDTYQIIHSSSDESGDFICYHCLKENGSRNRILFRRDGLVVIYDDSYSQTGIALSIKSRPVYN